MGSTYICPFCFQELRKSKVRFACINRSCRENSPENQRANGEGFSFEAKGIQIGLPKQAQCPSCKTISTKWLCSNCKNELPKSIENSNDMIISIIGSRDAGKSNFVAVLVNELKRIFSPFGYAVSIADVSREDYQRRFGNYIYNEHRIVNRTESAVGSELDLPIICTIEKRDGKKVVAYTFSFMDSAGEDFNNPKVMERVMPYISRSKGIIFLLDPMQIEQVRNQVSKEIVQGSSNVGLKTVMSSLEIVNNVADLVCRQKKCKEVSIPAVCSFSKIDTVRSLASKDSRIFQESPHSRLGYFEEDDAEMVSSELKGLLVKWGEIAFVQNFESKFKRACFLPCSAFGEVAQGGMLTRPHSLRIEDALLWILKENGVIPTKR